MVYNIQFHVIEKPASHLSNIFLQKILQVMATSTNIELLPMNICWVISNKCTSILLIIIPVAEFSVSICSTPKFICSSDNGVFMLLITEK